MWYGWYSKRQEFLYGSAVYRGENGKHKHIITEVNQWSSYTPPPYRDSVKCGRLTHYLYGADFPRKAGMKKRNREPDKRRPAEMELVTDGGGPCDGDRIAN